MAGLPKTLNLNFEPSPTFEPSIIVPNFTHLSNFFLKSWVSWKYMNKIWCEVVDKFITSCLNISQDSQLCEQSLSQIILGYISQLIRQTRSNLVTKLTITFDRLSLERIFCIELLDYYYYVYIYCAHQKRKIKIFISKNCFSNLLVESF